VNLTPVGENISTDKLNARLSAVALSEDVAGAILKGHSLEEMLQYCAKSIVHRLDAALARIWILDNSTNELILKASAGLYTHLNGKHASIPFGETAIGCIAKESTPYIIDDIQHSQLIQDQDWVSRESLISFVGYPLLVDDVVIGVMIAFSRMSLNATTIEAMSSVAKGVGIAVNRAKAQDELRLSEERYRFLYHRTPVMLYSMDNHGRVIRVSDYWLQVMGYAEAEVLGRRSSDFMTIESRTIMDKEYLDELFKTGGLREIPLTFVKQNGDMIDVLLSAITERDVKTNSPHSLAVLMDVTARNQAEAALQERERELSLLNDRLLINSNNLEKLVIERTQELEQRRKIIDSLSDILSILNLNHSIDQVFEYTVAQSRRLFNSDASGIYRIDPERGIFIPQNIQGDFSREISTEEFIAQWRDSLQRGQYIAVTDAEKLAQGKLTGDTLSPPPPSCCNSYLIIPLEISGKIYGCLALCYSKHRLFLSEEVELACAFGVQVSLAIENTGLRQRAKQAVVMEERSRLARELHDSVTQSLYSLTLLSEGWRRLALSGNLGDAVDPLTELGEVAQQALKEMRLLVYELRPPLLEQEGLLGALHQRLETVEKRAGVEARLVSDDFVELPIHMEEGLYRIAQEALNNIIKHAQASSVIVHLKACKQCVLLEITDDGIGFENENDRGLGMLSMKERAEQLGGMISYSSKPGEGTTVQVQIELQEGQNG
jgi:PAS domain S-box-containing protein